MQEENAAEVETEIDPAMSYVLEQMRSNGQKLTWLARELEMSRQAVNSWRTRGIPDRRIGDVARAVGIPDYVLRDIVERARHDADAESSGTRPPGARVTYYAWPALRERLESDEDSEPRAYQPADDNPGPLVSEVGSVVSPVETADDTIATRVVTSDIRYPRGSIVVIELGSDRAVDGCVALCTIEGRLTLRELELTETGLCARDGEGRLREDVKLVGVAVVAMMQ